MRKALAQGLEGALVEVVIPFGYPIRNLVSAYSLVPHKTPVKSSLPKVPASKGSDPDCRWPVNSRAELKPLNTPRIEQKLLNQQTPQTG